jgi:TonB family protein
MNPVHATQITSAVALMLAIPASRMDAQPRNPDTSAVDAKGVRHYREDYPQHHAPWMLDDTIRAFGPDYPRSDRMRYHQGIGLFRLTLDLKTGAVSRVTILRSTGFSTLDSCAVAAFRHSLWKPGKWREINIPVTFQMSSGPRPLKPGETRLPSWR